MSSTPSNRNAAQRERERRAAAKAKRQASKAASSEPAAPVVEPVERAVVARKATMAPARKEAKAVVAPAAVVDPETIAVPLGDPQGDVASWMMLGILFLLALLVVAVVFAS